MFDSHSVQYKTQMWSAFRGGKPQAPAHLANLFSFTSSPCALSSSTMEPIIVLLIACLCIYTFLCLNCTLLYPLDTLLLNIWSGIIFSLKLFWISVQNWPFICNWKLHVLYYNYLYPFHNGPGCVLFIFIILAPSTVVGPWKVLNKYWWTEPKLSYVPCIAHNVYHRVSLNKYLWNGM